MRIRGEFLAVQDQAPGVIADQAQVFWGVGPSNHDEGLPGGQYENPFSHSFSDDWMWWGSHFLYNSGPAGGTISSDPRNSITGAVRLPIDIRSKRRLDETDDLVVVVVNASPLVQAVDIGCVFSGRILLQET